MSSGKKGRGRQKIEMKRISNESNLQVAFSKRRSGLFKKASELCTLCGAEVALVVFSPTDKVYSFGHPNVDTIINRYILGFPPQDNVTMQFIEANARELNTQLTQTNIKLDDEKKRNDELSNEREVIKSQFWWARPVGEMNKEQLESYKKALVELKKVFAHHTDMLVALGPHIKTIPFIIGNASASIIALHHQPPPPHLFHGFNNMGGGYGPSGFF